MIRAGADIGGTWIRTLVLDSKSGRVVGRRAPAPPPGRWRQALKAATRVGAAIHSVPARLTVGSTGIWTGLERRRAAAGLAGLARRIRVLSDLELAHAGAFSGGAGIVVLAGTGSVALARDRAGRAGRAGGWGPLLGDEGSAFWIGRSALRDPGLRLRLGLGNPLDFSHCGRVVRRVAALAPRVLAAAAGNGAARKIAAEAGVLLADMAAESAAGLFPGRGAIRVACRGGVFSCPDVRSSFERSLRLLLPRADIRPPLLSPELAAVLLF